MTNARFFSGNITADARDRARDLRKNQTRAETIFWFNVRNRKFQGLKFLRQHPFFIQHGSGLTYYIADFYCHEKQLVVELDGSNHQRQAEEDASRDAYFQERGIRTVRFKNDEVEKNIDDVLRRIQEILIL